MKAEWRFAVTWHEWALPLAVFWSPVLWSVSVGPFTLNRLAPSRFRWTEVGHKDGRFYP